MRSCIKTEKFRGYWKKKKGSEKEKCVLCGKTRQSVINIPVWQWKMTLDGMVYISGPLKILTWLSSYFGRYFHLRTLSHFIQLKLLNLSWLVWKWMMKKWQKLHYKFSKIQEVKLKKTFLIYDRKLYILTLE